MEGVDFASPASLPQLQQLKKAGKQFICRYIAGPGSSFNWKRLTSAEVKAAKSLGLGLVVVFEEGAKNALGGFNRGVRDAEAAVQQLKALGIPAAPVYFAVDFDATPAQQAAINAYFKGASSKLGKNRVGIYSGFYPLKRAFDAGVVNFGWQTYAWSGGQWDKRAHIQQYKNGVHMAGLSLDLDRSTKANYGQVGAKVPVPPTPKPPPQPVPVPKPPGPTPGVKPKLEITDKDGSVTFEPYTKRGRFLRGMQFAHGKFHGVRVVNK